MAEAIIAEGVSKFYRIRETQEKTPTRRLKLAQFVLGETFKGKVEVKQKKVVDDLSISIQAGEVIALLGPNGAGKSTFLEMVATGIRPDAGTIRVMGHDTVLEREQAKTFITPIFPMFGSQHMWTARQNLEYVALLYNLSREEMTRRLDRVMDVIGLRSRADEIVMKYSTGMGVRLILGMGLMIDRDVYLMDEPFLGIDPGTAREIRAFLKDEVVSRGRTVLLATHGLEDVEQLCERAALMSEGRIVAIDTIAKLKASIRGTETITLEVSKSNVAEDETQSLLLNIQQMEGAVEATHSSTQDGVANYRVRTPDSRAFLPVLIEQIHQRGWKVRYVRVAEPTLEDVFVHYTGQRLAGE
ncbi:MAG: ABC transporter ATP-binding protein [Acidobacteria bacterium]|nr:ABC transporter ATP-binding protein [Acidobacteriota bacterium]MCI0591585.1 ABC transporter ATP-binding protein [Gammaproteobacteria bacterium]MCI0662419.1 ABC transporter ATP-binding protein [Acidobacteriota bacterium]